MNVANSIEMYEAVIYTDGSSDVQKKTGVWTAIIFVNEIKNIIHGVEYSTTHQRMELMGVIKSLKWIVNEHPGKNKILLQTDSQYIIELPKRKTKLIERGFMTSDKIAIRNVELVKEFFNLIIDLKVDLVKVKAHQKKSSTYNGNREVDLLCRKLLRLEVKK